MVIRKAFFSLLAKSSLLKDKYESPPPQRQNDSREDLEAWLREMEDKDGMDTQWNWVRKHKAEIRAGKQLIQREMHLSAQLSYLQNTAEEKGSLNPTQQDEMLQYETELKQINQDYLEHRERVIELENQRPPGRLAENRYYLHRRQTSPEAWKAEQYYCRARGGCCARDCGCCERNLRIVRDRKGGMQFTHCSPGCNCCKRHHGETREEIRVSSSSPI